MRITQAISTARTIMKRVVCLWVSSACNLSTWVSSARFGPWATNSFISPFAWVIRANVGTMRATAIKIPAATSAFLFIYASHPFEHDRQEFFGVELASS